VLLGSCSTVLVAAQQVVAEVFLDVDDLLDVEPCFFSV
jgi:hypothetical protein